MPGQRCRGQLRLIVLFAGALTLLWFVAGSFAQEPDPRQPSSGVQWFRLREFDKAAAQFQADLQAGTNQLESLIYLGRIAFEQNRLEEAAGYFEKATETGPQSSAAFHWLGRVYGLQARDLGPPRGIFPARRARKALEKAVELDPENVQARLDLATFYREAPGIVGGSTKAALAQVEEIKRRDPYLGALILGDLAMDQKKFDEAERQYQAAIALRPKETEAFFRLGVLHQKTGKYDKAFDAFEHMLQLNRNARTAYFQLGKTADLSGDRLARGEEALKIFLRSKPFYMMPKLSWAHRRLGNIYLKQGRRDAAREEYLAAVKSAPDDAEAAAALKQLDAGSRPK